MSRKINVKICAGTNCYVLGGADLLALEDSLSDEMKKYVNIQGVTCLGFCKDPQYGKAPFVLIEDELVSEASIPEVVKKIREYLEE